MTGRHAASGRLRALVEGRAVRAKESLAAMEERADAVRYGTRKRTGAALVAGFGALGGLFTLVSANALAVNFTSSALSFELFSNQITGTDGAGFIDEQTIYGGSKVGVAELGFLEAKLNGLCAYAKQTIGTIDYYLVLRAGETVDGSLDGTAEQISATNLFLASTRLAGEGKQIASMTMGQSAESVRMGTQTFPAGMTPTPGGFGLQAKTLTLADLSGTSYGIDLRGSINLPKLKINVLKPAAPLTKAVCTDTSLP